MTMYDVLEKLKLPNNNYYKKIPCKMYYIKSKEYHIVGKITNGEIVLKFFIDNKIL